MKMKSLFLYLSRKISFLTKLVGASSLFFSHVGFGQDPIGKDSEIFTQKKISEIFAMNLMNALPVPSHFQETKGEEKCGGQTACSNPKMENSIFIAYTKTLQAVDELFKTRDSNFHTPPVVLNVIEYLNVLYTEIEENGVDAFLKNTYSNEK